ncbi:MAG: DUF4177 domain-containing protein [Oscillospiraceae bacterium]|nr:DUF4177 domain-containing protein [Oscillospiraceae bacterium]
MEKWEYLSIELEPKVELGGKKMDKIVSSVWSAEHFTEQLNDYGKQGWELVSFFCIQAPIITGTTLATINNGTNGIFATFKRKM